MSSGSGSDTEPLSTDDETAAIPQEVGGTPVAAPPAMPVDATRSATLPRVNQHVVKRSAGPAANKPPGKPEQPVVFGPLVGRETEAATIREAIDRAIEFQAPQFVTVVGSRGTGKTPACCAVARHIRHPDGTRVLGACGCCGAAIWCNP